MKKNSLLQFAVLFSLLLLLPISGCAEDSKRDERGQHGPPPEAIEACKDKKAGDAVSFKGRRGESLKATCQEVEGTLVAVPEGHKPR